VLNSTTVLGGSVVDATLTLAGAAPAAGALVALSAEDPASVPSTVPVPAVTTSVLFAITTHAVESAKAAHITATYAGASATVVLTVTRRRARSPDSASQERPKPIRARSLTAARRWTACSTAARRWRRHP
jgi:hypothetical protein